MSLGKSDIDSSITLSSYYSEEGGIQEHTVRRESEDEPRFQNMINENQEQEEEKFWSCPKCHKKFSTKFNLNKHNKKVHFDAKRKYIKHIRKKKKLVCPVC